MQYLEVAIATPFSRGKVKLLAQCQPARRGQCCGPNPDSHCRTRVLTGAARAARPHLPVAAGQRTQATRPCPALPWSPRLCMDCVWVQVPTMWALSWYWAL